MSNQVKDIKKEHISMFYHVSAQKPTIGHHLLLIEMYSAIYKHCTGDKYI